MRRAVVSSSGRSENSTEIQVWNIPKKIQEPTVVKPHARHYDISRDGRYLYTYYWDDNSLHIWELESSKRLLSEAFPSSVSGATFSASAKYAAAATHDGLIRIWELPGMQLIQTLRTRADATWGLAFSKDERMLAASNFDGRVRVWDVETGEERITLSGISSACHDVAIAPDGRTIIGAYGGTAVMWRAAKDGEAPRYRRR